MKINWGTGIVIGMIAFMGFIITLATSMINRKVDLVAKDYYEQGEAYESRIESIKAANRLERKIVVKVDYSSERLEINFPVELNGKGLKGEIQVFRPSDAAKDFTEKVSVEGTKQYILLSKMSRGNWKIKIICNADGKEYYFEEEVVI